MSFNCSEAYAMILNIINAAKWHKENCHDSCNVSLYLLKEAALNLRRDCTLKEQAIVTRMVEETNWM